MFANKNKTDKTGEDQDLVAKVNSDLLVRNMPSQARLNGLKSVSSKETLESGDNVLSTISPVKNNHQTIGILIIVGGFILIAGLVYASYVFIIKPQTKVTTAPQENNINNANVVNIPKATTTNEILVASSSVTATVTPTVLDLATSSASTTMAEEGSGVNNADLPPLLDADTDGINDGEEAVLGTNPNLADTNDNTYSDLVEINNGYDPVGSGKLSLNKNLATYTDKTLGYTVLYPKDWIVSSLSNDSVVVFTTPDDSIIQVSYQDNSDKQSILDWYDNSFPDVTVTNDMLKSTATWDGIWGSDKLNFYLTDKKKKNIYIVSYISAITDRVAYPNIYKLMINSLVLK